MKYFGRVTMNLPFIKFRDIQFGKSRKSHLPHFVVDDSVENFDFPLPDLLAPEATRNAVVCCYRFKYIYIDAVGCFLLFIKKISMCVASSRMASTWRFQKQICDKYVVHILKLGASKIFGMFIHPHG